MPGLFRLRRNSTNLWGLTEQPATVGERLETPRRRELRALQLPFSRTLGRRRCLDLSESWLDYYEDVTCLELSSPVHRGCEWQVTGRFAPPLDRPQLADSGSTPDRRFRPLAATRQRPLTERFLTAPLRRWHAASGTSIPGRRLIRDIRDDR